MGVLLAVFLSMVPVLTRKPRLALDFKIQGTARDEEVAKIVEERADSIVGGAMAMPKGTLVTVYLPGPLLGGPPKASTVNRVKALLLAPGRLESRILVLPPIGSRGDEDEMETRERTARERLGKDYPGPPPGYRWVPLRERSGEGARDRLLEIPEEAQEAQDREKNALRTSIFTGGDLDPAALCVVPNDRDIGWGVLCAMRDDRKDAFAEFTEKNRGRQLAILIDGKLLSAGTIMYGLTDKFVIHGPSPGFSEAEAEDLAAMLRTGPLPAPLCFLGQRDLPGDH